MPAARSTQSKPASSGKVEFDLTVLDIHPDAPVSVRIAPGVTIRLRNIRDLDWQVAASLSKDRPHQLFEEIVVKEDQEKFLVAKLSDKHMDALFEFYMAHFELKSGESPA